MENARDFPSGAWDETPGAKDGLVPAGSGEPTAGGECDSLQAWVMAVAAFFAMFVVYGVAYSFGVLLRPVASEFKTGNAITSTLFSAITCTYLVLGVFTGRTADKLGPRPVLVAGALAMAIGLCLSAIARRFYLIFFTYSVGVGLGVACAYVPTVAMVGGWFRRYRTTALGLAVAGIGTGTLVATPLSAALVARFGWRLTNVIYGIGGGAVLMACAAVCRRPPYSGAVTSLGALNVKQVIRTPGFLMIYAGWLFYCAAIFVAIVFLPSAARSLGVPRTAAAWLVGIIGGTSVVGRFGLGALGDRVGAIRLTQICMAVMALSFGLWAAAKSYPMLVLFAVVLGVSYGGAVSLVPAVVADLFGTESLGAILGALFTGGAVGTFIGPPVAGMIIDATGSYALAAGFTGLLQLASFLAFAPLSASHAVRSGTVLEVPAPKP